jgi:hypothetical protein
MLPYDNVRTRGGIKLHYNTTACGNFSGAAIVYHDHGRLANRITQRRPRTFTINNDVRA